MTLNYGNRVIGEIRPDGLHGHAGLGMSQLRFSLSWNIHPRQDHLFRIFSTSIWVSARPEGESQWHMLGHAMPETAWSDECREGAPFDRLLLYRLTLPDPQLLAVEHARKGRAMWFQLEARGHVHGPDGILSLDSTVTLQVNASDWARVLKEANAVEVLLVGVHLPVAGSDGEAQAPIGLVRKANEHLLQGNYDDAVAQCRRAIESLWKATKLKNHAKDARTRFAKMPEREAMTKLDRELALGEALLNFTHPAHHVNADAEPEVFSRLDAALAVAATAGLVSSLAAVRDRLLPAVAETESKLGAQPGHKSAKPRELVTPAERVAHVRMHLAARPANRPGTIKKLRSAMGPWFNNKLDATQIDEVLAELMRQRIVVETAGKLTYPDAKG